MAVHSKLWYLQRFHMLDALTDPQKRAVEKMTRVLEVPREERIYLAGDPSDQIFLLKSGVVKISTGGADGQDTILAFLYPRGSLARPYAKKSAVPWGFLRSCGA